MTNELFLRRLRDNTELKSFDCVNSELNDFLFSDAKKHQEECIAQTYLIVSNEEILAYWCYLNDKISVSDMNGNRESFIKRIASRLGREIKDKEYESFPAVKIGRIAITAKYQRSKDIRLGTYIINYTKQLFVSNNRTGCRFITVDAFREAIPFYLKNGFEFISSRDRKSETRQMYCDLLQL
ncbi:hypothetical protein Barb4_01435 [Bacteroidales bacterium Barb4]|nr:hypothetical protein Barb4_01435 [Bacteroidales bacterium Barb4]